MSCSEQLHGDEITLHAANTCLLRAPSAFIVYKRGPLQAACGRRMLPQLAIAVFATIKRPCHPQQEACERTHRLDLEARAVVRVEVHDLAQPAAAGCGGCRGCRCGKRCERFPKRCSSSVRARVAGAVRAARAAIAPAAAPCAPPAHLPLPKGPCQTLCHDPGALGCPGRRLLAVARWQIGWPLLASSRRLIATNGLAGVTPRCQGPAHLLRGAAARCPRARRCPERHRAPPAGWSGWRPPW